MLRNNPKNHQPNEVLHNWDNKKHHELDVSVWRQRRGQLTTDSEAHIIRRDKISSAVRSVRMMYFLAVAYDAHQRRRGWGRPDTTWIDVAQFPWLIPNRPNLCMARRIFLGTERREQGHQRSNIEAITKLHSKDLNDTMVRWRIQI